jgi:serine protease Do
MKTRRLAGAGLVLAVVGVALAWGQERKKDPTIGQSYRVPYRLTETNHYLVRVQINGKGPFNFLVDTGAPALYISTETAQKVGLEPSKTSYWTDVDRFDIEGGATLRHLKARVEDPYQLVGMNALGLPGASIDGILGFTLLARFRLEFDPTQDRMVWTRLDFEPKEPPLTRKAGENLPPEIQAMNLIGPIAKIAAALVGKQPEDQLHPRGFLGLELAETEGGLRIVAVLPGSPAAKGGVQAGDRLLRLLDRDVSTLKSAHEAVAELRPGARVSLKLRRGPGTIDLTLTAGEGF